MPKKARHQPAAPGPDKDTLKIPRIKTRLPAAPPVRPHEDKARKAERKAQRRPPDVESEE